MESSSWCGAAGSGLTQRHFKSMEKSRCLKATLSKVFTESQPVGFPKLLHQASSSPPSPGASIQQIRSTMVRDRILKIGAKLPGFSLHHCMFVAPYRAQWGSAVAVLPYRTVPVCYCVHTVRKHKQEHRYRDVPAQNTSTHRTRLKFRAHAKAGN